MAKAKKFTTVKEAPIPDEGRAPYTPDEAQPRRARHNTDPNAEPAKEDRVYGVASRARWNGGSDITEMHRESRQIEGAEGAEQEEEEEDETSASDLTVAEQEEEEEEETSASDLTVAELKEALDAAEVEYGKNAKKADLVELYEANDFGNAE